MVTTLQSSNSIGTGVRFTFAANGDNYAILDDVVVASVDVDAISGTLGNNKLNVEGTVIAEQTGIFLSGGDNRVTIAETGKVVSNITGTTGSAVSLGTNEGGSLLANHGQISAPGRIGVLGPRVDVLNHGTIDGVSPVFLGVFGRAGATLTNTGTITAAGDGEDVGTRYNNAVYFEGDNGLVTNSASGVIAATFGGGAGIRFGSNDGSGGAGGRVTNAGEIYSVAGVGIDASEVPTADGVTIFNTGLISGGSSAILGSDFTDQVTNLGDILGNVRLGGGSDFYRAFGDGEVTGEVNGGNGADILIGGKADDRLSGEAGSDVVRGGAGDDFIEGVGGDDSLYGGAGDDTLVGAGDSDDLYGGAGDDSLDAGNAADDLRGGQGDDTLEGGRAKDKLAGGRGDDVLDGGTEDDVLNGGKGNDTLTGGEGADTFTFFEGSGVDRIEDFENGLDQVDMRTFGLSNFSDLNSTFTIEATSDGVRLIAGDDILVINGLDLADVNGADFSF